MVNMDEDGMRKATLALFIYDLVVGTPVVAIACMWLLERCRRGGGRGDVNNRPRRHRRVETDIEAAVSALPEETTNDSSTNNTHNTPNNGNGDDATATAGNDSPRARAAWTPPTPVYWA